MAVALDTYRPFLAELKQRIRSARLAAALSVNKELVLLYWSIGRDILARQRRDGWGAKVIDRLAADLRRAFPDMTGMSPRNLRYMRTFARVWPDQEFVQQVVAQLPLRCFIVFELKMEAFKPEFSGKMNFYLSVIDSQLRNADDQPSIGIILCKGRNEVVVEYALRDMSKPMGVAEYRLSTNLPKRLQRELPVAEDLAREVDSWLGAQPRKYSSPSPP